VCGSTGRQRSGVIDGREDEAYDMLPNAHVVGFFNDEEGLVMPDGAELAHNNPLKRRCGSTPRRRR
jgi:hypothetical protein